VRLLLLMSMAGKKPSLGAWALGKLGLGVNGLAKAHVPNSQENWEERLELAAKRRPSLKLALG
jgi:hypothetical protein